MKNTVTTDELIKRMESGPLALFDVRGDLEFELGHIPGAMTAPLGSLSFRVASVMNPESYLVVYAGDPDDGLAAEAVDRLQHLRLRNVHCYEGGIKGWQAAGQAVIPSVDAKVQGRGPVVECRPLVVDRERAYGGVFNGRPVDGEGAGG